MNRFIKSVLLAGALAASVSFPSFADQSVKDLANEISAKGGTFYTLYIGMPPEEYSSNWEGIPGWEFKDWQPNPRIPNVLHSYNREINLDGKPAMEQVTIHYSKGKPLFQISYRLMSNDLNAISKFYSQVYGNLKKFYPRFQQKVRYTPYPKDGQVGGMELPDGSRVSLSLSKYTAGNSKSIKYKYYFELQYFNFNLFY